MIMNTQSPNQWIDTINLFDYCFDNFQVFNIAENETSYTSSETKNAGSLNNNEPFVDIDKKACIVLPKTAKFKDAASEITYENESEQVVGTISYTYAGRTVGKADIVTTGVEIQGYVFDNQEKEEQTEQTLEKTSTLQIKPTTVVAIVAGILILVIIGLFVKRFADNFYIIKHNLEVRRDRRTQFKTIKKRKMRRRRHR